MVVSLVLGFLATFVATMGMKCTNCGGDDKVKKARIAMTGGIIFILAGEPQVQGGDKDSVNHAGGVSVDTVRVWGGGSQYLNPHFSPRSCCLDSLLLVRPSDCLRFL